MLRFPNPNGAFATHLLLLETMFGFGKKIPNLATKKKRGEDFNLGFFGKKSPKFAIFQE